jgi:competence protein ComFC
MNLLERIISLYAPHACVGCATEGSLLCMSCIDCLEAPQSVCYLCRKESRNGRTCLECRSKSDLVSLNSLTQYAGVAKDLLWSLKFDRAQAAADIIGQLLTEQYAGRVSSDVLIVPVPTATSRVRKRGYDQAVLIARSFARHSERQYTPLLIRQGSQEQIGASSQQRHDQLRGAYVLNSNPLATQLAGKRIMLIDDVATTGATLEEAASVLKSSGAGTVGALVFARA